MRSIKLFLFSLLFLPVLGCSSDGEDTIVYVPVTTAPPVDTPWDFNLKVNGVEMHTGAPAYVFKRENNFSIMVGKSEFSFDKSGHFGFYSYDDGTKFFKSYRDFSSHYFDFMLISVDETNKRIKGSFSGYLYFNESNLSSESKFVSGTFDTGYTDTVPAVGNLGNTAKINGTDWISTNKYATRTIIPGGWNVVHNSVSDDNYKIMVHYANTTNVGTYNFTNSDTTNKVQLAKFDPATGTYTNYDTNGTMAITIHDGTVYAGTYHFTAVNPNNASDVIQVTDGAFKLIYNF